MKRSKMILATSVAILALATLIPAHAVTAKKLVFVQQPSAVTAGQAIAPEVTVAVVDQQGRLVTDSTAPVTIAIATNPGGAALAGTSSANADGGIAHFSNLRLTIRGTGYELGASSPGLDPATSDPFNVTGAADLCDANGCSVGDPDGTNATRSNRVTGSAAITTCTAPRDDTFLSFDESPSFTGCNGTCDDPIVYLWDCIPGETVLLIYTADKIVVKEDLSRGATQFTLFAGGVEIPKCAVKGVLDPDLSKCISRQNKTQAGDLVSEVLSTPDDARITH